MDKNLKCDLEICAQIPKEEPILWSGKPTKEIKLLPGEKFNLMLGIFWTVFAAFWIVITVSASLKQEQPGFSANDILPYIGIPLLALGIYMVLISPIRIIKNRKSIEYALTTEHVFILYNGKKPKIRSFAYSEITNINFGADENDVGVVTFMAPSYIGKSSFVKTALFGLYYVPNVKKIYKILSERLGE